MTTFVKVLGSTTGRYSLVEPSEQDRYMELTKVMRKTIRSVMTFELSSNQLERRAYLRMFFGIESGSLIHNGKKRRKR